MRKLEREGQERRGGEELLQKGSKSENMRKKTKRTHQIGQNAKTGEGEQEERRGGEGSH